MNRPNIEDFIYCNAIIDDEKYEKALEEYCDELEKVIKYNAKYIQRLEKELIKLYEKTK